MKICVMKVLSSIAALATLCVALHAVAAQSPTAQIVGATNKFLSTLDDAQRKRVQFAFDDQQQRARWSNLPISSVPRAGLSMGELNATQRPAALAVVATRARRPAPHLTVAAASLTMAFVAMLLLYQFTNYAEHRVLSAFLLFGVLLCIAAPGRIGPLLVAGIILSNMVSARTSLIEFEDIWRDRFTWDRRGVFELERALDGTVVYRPEASRWCNTLLTSQYPPHLTAVPAGIGISVVRKPELMTLPPRSHYLLLDELVRAAFTGPLNLEPIATLPYGTLYVNRDSGCR